MTMNTAASVVVVGGGPAGLAAAEALAQGGCRVAVYDAMPTLGRKFLLAGVGGLNLTHSEAFETFVSRYAAPEGRVRDWLTAFPPEALRLWAARLGVETFVGSSGRVFPREMKAAPLLRAWLRELRAVGVQFFPRHRWVGWNAAGALRFIHASGETCSQPAACVLALGGASWPRLGSDAAWVPWLTQRGVALRPFEPANCGFDAALSDYFLRHFAGQPVKSIAVRIAGSAQPLRKGEFMISDTGVEGSLIYALSRDLREQLAAAGQVTLEIDLAPDKSAARVASEVMHPRGSRSLSSHLASRCGLKGVKTALLREALGEAGLHDPARLAAAIKALPLRLLRPRPIDEAISSAGGVMLDALDNGGMLNALPGVFCAGEMLDWDAPTGGYLLTACFASGRAAARGVLDYLAADGRQACVD